MNIYMYCAALCSWTC